jgi:hypothetical protein
MGESPEGDRLARLKAALRGLRGGVHSGGDGPYKYTGLGLTFALAILLFLGLGYKLDQSLGTLPIFTLIGAFIGGIGGFLHLYRSVVRDSNDSNKKPPSP